MVPPYSVVVFSHHFLYSYYQIRMTTLIAQPFIWSDAFLLGYGPMDQTHREFVTSVQALQIAPEDQLLQHLQAFARHAEKHFGEENQWMDDTQFPARECHINEHAAVLASIYEVMDEVKQGRSVNVARLTVELIHWFPGHANYLDSALAHWMCKQRLGGKPVIIRRDIVSNTSTVKTSIQ
jgi:hemerythrin-like metal-binding protein